MKTLAIALLSISSTLAVRLGMRTSSPDVFKRPVPTKQTELDFAQTIGALSEVIVELDELVNSEDALQAFWDDIFQRFDLDGEAGLSKDEFHAAINEWTQNHGFGEQLKAGSDAIFDDLNEDKNDVLSLDEAIAGSQEIFAWYRDLAQNRLRIFSNELNRELEVTRCKDTMSAFTRLQYPSIPTEVINSWDEDGSGAISREELGKNLDVYLNVLSIEPLSEKEVDRLYNKFEADSNGEISVEDAWELFLDYTEILAEKACRNESRDK